MTTQSSVLFNYLCTTGFWLRGAGASDNDDNDNVRNEWRTQITHHIAPQTPMEKTHGRRQAGPKQPRLLTLSEMIFATLLADPVSTATAGRLQGLAWARRLVMVRSDSSASNSAHHNRQRVHASIHNSRGSVAPGYDVHRSSSSVASSHPTSGVGTKAQMR
eukprot:COSAG03_NODE_608_length_6729_cov_4.821267_1_plen_161_part_00